MSDEDKPTGNAGPGGVRRIKVVEGRGRQGAAAANASGAAATTEKDPGAIVQENQRLAEEKAAGVLGHSLDSDTALGGTGNPGAMAWVEEEFRRVAAEAAETFRHQFDVAAATGMGIGAETIGKNVEEAGNAKSKNVPQDSSL